MKAPGPLLRLRLCLCALLSLALSPSIVAVATPADAPSPSPSPSPLRVVIVGDSTVCDYPPTRPDRGWGMFIEERFRPGSVKVINLARAGRSTKTFIQEGRWQQALAEKPDYVFIQFGHNDSHAPDKPEATDPATDYKENLRRYIDESRAAGAAPILVTPMVRRTFDAQGKIADGPPPERPLSAYAEAMKAVGAEKQTALIDLYASSRALAEKLGPEASAKLANKPGDATHFNEAGARAMADLVLQGLPAAAPKLAALLSAAPPQAADPAPSAPPSPLPSPAPEAPLWLADMPLHDPFILAHQPSRTYYLYTSNQPRVSGTPGVGTMAYRSNDLRHWEKPRAVFIVPPAAFAQQGAWAPEVHEYRGRFYLFTTLFNDKKTIAEPPEAMLRTYARGTVTAVSDSPAGPFQMLNEQAPVPPADFMTLDGTFYVDPNGKPWMVYAHEWIQKIDGTMEAVPLTPDLSAAAGKPIHLFKASDAPWLNAALQPDTRAITYTTDGPELFRTGDGHLLMLWSSYENGSYVQTVARSKSGALAGPWEQLDPLVKNDSGHGMLFRTFEGQLMMVLHRPFKSARGKLYEMADRGDRLEVLRERTDLDGD